MAQNFEQLYSEVERQANEQLPEDIFAALRREPGRSLIIYGAGGNCQSAIYTVCFMDCKVTAICDKAARGKYIYHHTNRDLTEYTIISPEYLRSEHQDAFVLISTWNYEEEIRAELIQSGFPADQIFYYRAPESICVSPAEFREKHLAGYRWAYDFFCDDISRKNIINRIKLLLLRKPCPANSPYEEGYWGFPGIPYSDNEVYVDCGAYIGDTAEEFIQAVTSANKSYSHIYAFEPDPHNLQAAEKNLAQYQNIELIPRGLWHTTTQLHFDSRTDNDYITSTLTTGGGFAVQVTALDEFFSSKPIEEWPTLIKMDIEGSESAALAGAAEIIRLKKPKLIICAYHKPEDIYELTETILRFRPDYKFSLWQVGNGFWDIILYAV